MGEKIVGTGHVVAGQHFRQPQQMTVEAVHQGARVARQPDRNHRLQANTDRFRRDLGVVAQQDLRLTHPAHPFQRGGGGDAGFFRQVLVGQACILSQQAQQGVVDSVEHRDFRRKKNIVRTYAS